MLTEVARQYQAAAQADESPRARYMALLDAYYHGCQYDFLPRAWHEDLDAAGAPVPFRSRRPSTILPIPRVIVRVFVRALWGAGRRPKASLAGGSPEATVLLDDVVKEARLVRAMSEATSRALRIGTGLVVWRLDSGRLCADVWDAKCAEPTFKPGAFPELASLDYRFKYKREVRDPETGHVKQITCWHRETIDANTWTIYRDVEVSAASEPTWTASSTLEHGLGLVPAVWFTVGERGEHDFDGTGAYAPYIGLLDELNYTASQMGRALYYNLDPQNVITGIREEELGDLIKSGRNTWCLPSGAEAKLLESSGAYVDQAQARLELLKKSIYDACGVVLPDPDRIKGAQSGASIELLMVPHAAEVDSLREDVGDAYVRLLEQIWGALHGAQLAPDKVRVNVRDGRAAVKPDGRIELAWGTILPIAVRDTLAASQAASTANSMGAISRPAAARYLSKFFGVEDVDGDQELVKADEARQDQRLSDYSARRDFAAGHDHLPPHLEGEAEGGEDS